MQEQPPHLELELGVDLGVLLQGDCLENLGELGLILPPLVLVVLVAVEE